MNGETMNDECADSAGRSSLVRIVHHQLGEAQPQSQARALITERPLTINVQGGEQYTLMRTPGHDLELAAGFLFSEGVIDSFDEIMALEHCPARNDLIQVRLRRAKKMPRRALSMTSSCGLCGRQDIEALVRELPVITNDCMIAAERLYELPALVLARQELFRETGGAHAAVLFNEAGEILVLREDIGRHNALDKLLGQALAHRLSFMGKGLYLSGRASLEMIVKAARAQVALVAAASAPSALAVDLALRLGITLCGFVRGKEIVVYSHDRRIQPALEPSLPDVHRQ